MTKDEFETQLAWLQANLDAEREVRQAAEAERNKALEFIREICRAFIPDDLDRILRESKIEVERWNPLDCKNFILTKGMARLRRLELLSSGDLSGELPRAQAEIGRLQDELKTVQDLRDQLAHAQVMCAEAQAQITARDEELSRLRNEVTRLQTELVKARESTIDRLPLPDSPAPDWFVQWQASREFEQDAALVRVVGYQGFCLRKSAETALVEAGVIPADNRAGIQRLFTRVKEQGLVEESVPQTETGIGRAPFLLRLTERGREAFRLLFGREAVESEYDRLLVRHKSDEHVLLNIQARDVLLEYGAEAVDLYPQPVRLPSGGTFDVDLVAIFPDQPPLYVEAERGGKKKSEERDRKWANYRLVTGDFYIVVPNKKAQAQIVTEITTWAYQARTRLTLHVCNLSLLGKEGGPLWQFEREIGLSLR
jgi:hypothetical protein